ncbi:MAG: hypothetical protein FD162_2799 [Rhodobacteraceae bacterium]|uniref:DUF2852 domain-containing protein n=1 Tax=Cypionkella sp. TaxID=2811411 RepID=UPI001322A574|nr:DUF2852 domain-containing protein [Cypionkella sp.]KAF0171715.1 MAG: hypothetical protein FD162_2799 [Paracoccaceae bacterium]MDO8325891.1 DUF2852 domain-containing protein [Cypionkella sp.]
MNTASTTAPSSGGFFSYLRRAEAWLDDKGRGAWIAAMVLGFIFVWPVGLALLAYMIWSKRMFNRSSCAERRARHFERHAGGHWGHAAMRPSGNAAFDAYKADMLRRLEDEQTAFESFLQRLREAKDKSEFDSFMEDRARAASAPVPAADVARPGEY